MKGNLARALLSATAVALLAFSAGCEGRQEGEPRAKEREVFAPAPKEKAVTIPLTSVYSTSRQKGLRRGGDAYIRELNLLNDREALGPTNVLLVRGKDIAEAVKATRRAYAADGWGDTPVPP